METELIREYASKMSRIFAKKAKDALSGSKDDDYVSYLEHKRDFWERVAQLPPDSDKWELVNKYINLMSTSGSKMELRTLYQSLQENLCKV
jgi:hypothetical protein